MGFLEGLGRSRAITGTLSAIDQLKANEQARAINAQNLRMNEMEMVNQERAFQYQQQQLDAQAKEDAMEIDVNYSPTLLSLHPETRKFITQGAMERGILNEQGIGQKGAWKRYLGEIEKESKQIEGIAALEQRGMQRQLDQLIMEKSELEQKGDADPNKIKIKQQQINNMTARYMLSLNKTKEALEALQGQQGGDITSNVVADPESNTGYSYVNKQGQIIAQNAPTPRTEVESITWKPWGYGQEAKIDKQGNVLEIRKVPTAPRESAAGKPGQSYDAWEKTIDRRLKQVAQKYKLSDADMMTINPNDPNALMALFAKKGMGRDAAKMYLAEVNALESARETGLTDIEVGKSPYGRLKESKANTAYIGKTKPDQWKEIANYENSSQAIRHLMRVYGYPESQARSLFREGVDKGYIKIDEK